MFYKNDLGMVKILLTILKGLKKNYDYVMVVSGDTGVGKSMFVLHLLETWTKMIGKEVNAELMNHINVEKTKWLENFRDFKEYDINIFDEGAKGLSSKQWNETFSKMLEQLFQVIRYKKFFTIIVVPNFFRLDKFFREDRLRGLIHINKRGHYKYFTRKRVVELTGRNDRLYVKNMNLVNALHTNIFPDYKGVMLKEYDKMKSEGVDKIIEETINRVTEHDKPTYREKIKPRVLELRKEGKEPKEIIEIISKEEEAPTSKTMVYNILQIK